MKVLITGATGFIGGAIARYLVAQGAEVIALDQRDLVAGGFSKVIIADIGRTSLAKSIADEIDSCDAVVHAAAAMDKNLYNFDISLTNCLGTQQLLYLAKIWHVKSFIFLSGVTVIGLPRELPITEEHPITPRSAYLSSKLYGEYLVDIASTDSMAGTVLRLTAPIGPGMPDNRILADFVKKSLAGMPLTLLGKGTRRQNYVDMRDIISAVWTCLQRRISGTFNIAGRSSITNRELAERCIRLLGSSSEIEFTGAPDPEEGMVWDVSIHKAKELLSFDPHHDIDDMIKELGSYYADRLY
jgi:UDP-glucuronate decarboxylase